MRKPISQKRQAVKDLKMWINLSRKVARQINRKIESLGQINKMKAAAQQRLIQLCSPK